MPKPPLQERVRDRFRRLVEAGGVSHEVLGKFLGLSRSGVSRLLNDEGSGFALHHIERLCEFFQVSPAEVCADPEAVIQPIKPLEAQLLNHFRRMTELERHGLLTVLDRPGTATEKRRAPRMGHPELTTEQQLVIDLYARSGPQEREGVLKILKGTARKPASERPSRGDTTG